MARSMEQHSHQFKVVIYSDLLFCSSQHQCHSFVYHISPYLIRSKFWALFTMDEPYIMFATEAADIEKEGGFENV